MATSITHYLLDMNDNKSLQLAIEKRDALIKLGRKFKNRNNIVPFVYSFFVFAFSFTIFKSCGTSGNNPVSPSVVILGICALVALFSYSMYAIYKGSIDKYELNIFDSDDLDLIKSDAYLSYYWEKALLTDNGTQYISESFQDAIEERLSNILKVIEYSEIFELNRAISAERIQNILNDNRFEKFSYVKSSDNSR